MLQQHRECRRFLSPFARNCAKWSPPLASVTAATVILWASPPLGRRPLERTAALDSPGSTSPELSVSKDSDSSFICILCPSFRNFWPLPLVDVTSPSARSSLAVCSGAAASSSSRSHRCSCLLAPLSWSSACSGLVASTKLLACFKGQVNRSTSTVSMIVATIKTSDWPVRRLFPNIGFACLDHSACGMLCLCAGCLSIFPLVLIATFPCSYLGGCTVSASSC